MKRFAIYLRTSTTKQGKGLDSQFKALEAHLKSKNIRLEDVEIFEDYGYSGKNTKRPGLNNLMNLVKTGKIHTVVCYSFSRISRSIKDLIEVVETFENHDVKFLSLSENVNTDTAMGRCFLNIIASLSQAEAEILQERTKAGLKAARERGVQLGRKKTRNSKLIRELHKQGYSFRKISLLANCSVGTVHNEIKTLNLAS